MNEFEWRRQMRELRTPIAPSANLWTRIDAALEPARRFPKTLDQGLGAVHFSQPGLDVTQPRQIGLAGILAQGRFRIVQFPK